MLDKKTYFKFSSKAKKVISDCFLGTEFPKHDIEDIFAASGFSPFTNKTTYYYSKKAAIDSQNDLLDICKMLPKEDIFERNSTEQLFIKMFFPKRKILNYYKINWLWQINFFIY